MAVQQTVFTRRGVNRVMRYAFELRGREKTPHLRTEVETGYHHTMPLMKVRCECCRFDIVGGEVFFSSAPIQRHNASRDSLRAA